MWEGPLDLLQGKELRCVMETHAVLMEQMSHRAWCTMHHEPGVTCLISFSSTLATGPGIPLDLVPIQVPLCILGLLQPSSPGNQLRVLHDFLRAPAAIYAALTMANDEMQTVRELDADSLREFAHNLWFYSDRRPKAVGSRSHVFPFWGVRAKMSQHRGVLFSCLLCDRSAVFCSRAFLSLLS